MKDKYIYFNFKRSNPRKFYALGLSLLISSLILAEIGFATPIFANLYPGNEISNQQAILIKCNEYMKGISCINISIDTEINGYELLLNGTTLTTSNVDYLVYSLDTTAYIDGIYNITVKASGPSRLQSCKFVFFANGNPEIIDLSTSPASSLDDKMEITISASIISLCLQDSWAEYTMLGQTIEIQNGNDPSFFYSTIFMNGTYIFTLHAIDKAGNQASETINFTVAHSTTTIHL